MQSPHKDRKTNMCTCSGVAPASRPSAKEVISWQKSSALQEDQLPEPRTLLICLMTGEQTGTKDKNQIK